MCRSCGNCPRFWTVTVYVPGFSVSVAGWMVYSVSLNVTEVEDCEPWLWAAVACESPVPPQAAATPMTAQHTSHRRTIRVFPPSLLMAASVHVQRQRRGVQLAVGLELHERPVVTRPRELGVEREMRAA